MATKEEIERAAKSKGTENLPPAGHGRDEALKLRQVALEEEAEKLAEQMIIGEIPKKFMELDREIVRHLDQLDVTDKRPDMHYYWANFKAEHGHHIERKKLVGFEVVSGTGEDCPEGHELVTEDGTRRIGDVLLMRVPKDRALYLKARERADSLKRRGILQNPEALAEMAYKHTGGRIRIHTSLSEDHKRIAEQRVAQRYNQMERAYARLGKQLEGGKVVDPSHFSGRM